MRQLLIKIFIPAFVLVSCGDGKDQVSSEELNTKGESIHMRESMPDIEGISELQTPNEEPVRVEVKEEDLPKEITSLIANDSLLSTLELETAYSVTDGEKKYYDLTFVTEDQEDIIVSFDHKGNLLEL
ncbi:hypothetical protein KZP23_10910 [Echinicola marina]|uniref:hypothetical protein n=1 Tax=Echinicola marina TaxID=2859768 RepID=UPI001CF682B6|nr:hypothetical protein [Echinicola marina]UCS95478.1 hypothetical protein KZP23_10910 [Echinicola marina]